MCSWARNTVGGKGTVALPMFESPGWGRTTALSAGKSPRLVPPVRRKLKRGTKSRAEQLETWKGVLADPIGSSSGEEKLAPEPVRAASARKRWQLVGLMVKPGR